MQERLSKQAYLAGIQKGDILTLSKAITLVESKLPQDQELAEDILINTRHLAGNSIRIGITGPPGVGKSTFIESFGKIITSQSKKLAVLAVDPTSQKSGGSILGDKTRMESLSKDSLAFIRPSASGGALGGVGVGTRESVLLCEAAGYEIILIETVGVGQSETSVRNMVDFFLLLHLPGSGDELQGIKRGIIELADLIVITKADQDRLKEARKAQADFQHALHLFPTSPSGWETKVMTCSAFEGKGLEEIWDQIQAFKKMMVTNDLWQSNRDDQNLGWMKELISHHLARDFYQKPGIKQEIEQAGQQVKDGKIPVTKAVRDLLSKYFKLS